MNLHGFHRASKAYEDRCACLGNLKNSKGKLSEGQGLTGPVNLAGATQTGLKQGLGGPSFTQWRKQQNAAEQVKLARVPDPSPCLPPRGAAGTVSPR